MPADAVGLPRGPQGGGRRARAADALHAAVRGRARRRVQQAQDEDAQGEALPLLVQHVLRGGRRRRREGARARRQSVYLTSSS